jgi:hypothetical protein
LLSTSKGKIYTLFADAEVSEDVVEDGVPGDLATGDFSD